MLQGTVRWARSCFEISGLPQILRNRPALARACFFQVGPGGGILHFQDGSLLNVNLKQGADSGDCIDFVHMMAHCTLTFEINGGTGRFQDASGVLTYAETATPVLFDLLKNVVLGTETGEITITGTVSGVPIGDGQN